MSSSLILGHAVFPAFVPTRPDYSGRRASYRLWISSPVGAARCEWAPSLWVSDLRIRPLGRWRDVCPAPMAGFA